MKDDRFVLVENNNSGAVVTWTANNVQVVVSYSSLLPNEVRNEKELVAVAFTQALFEGRQVLESDVAEYIGDSSIGYRPVIELFNLGFRQINL